MYSRYVPREGGGYERRPVAEPAACPPPHPPSSPSEPEPSKPSPCPHCPRKQGSDPSQLLRQLLKRELDPGDLLIVLILLLLLVEHQDQQLTILLTLGFFLVL